MCLKWTQIIFMFAIEITLGQHFSIKNISIRDAFKKKKLHMEGKVPYLSYPPPPPYKSRELNTREFFGCP